MSNITTTKINYWEKVVIPDHIRIVWEELASQPDIEVYCVGGAVRDLLMQQFPKNKRDRIMPRDWDLVTNATPSRIRKVFGARNVVQEENNKKFGVTFVQLYGQVVEVSTFREDITVGRRSDVRFSQDMTPDARRRDFTVNALYLDLNGRVYDPTDRGINHIKQRTLELIGSADDNITANPLRLLRGIRFVAMGFKPSNSTRTALFNNPTHISTFSRKVPKEMIREELLKMMSEDIREGVQSLVDSSLMDVILPEFTSLVDFDQRSELQLHNADKHSVETAVNIQRRYKNNGLRVDTELVLIGLLHDIAKPECQEIDDETGNATYPAHGIKGSIMIGKIFKRLQFTNYSIKRAKVLVKNHMALHQKHDLTTFLKLVDTLSRDNINMRDLLWLYKGDLYASRREKSYLPDNFQFPTVQPAIKSKEIMRLIESTFGNGYDKTHIGKVERRMRQLYHDFPNIPTFQARSEIKEYITEMKDNE